MTSKTSKASKYAISAAAAAILVVTGAVRADDGGDGGELFPVSYVGSDDVGLQASCDELREIARFEVELKRTDGDVAPEMPTITCGAEIYAESTIDAD